MNTKFGPEGSVRSAGETDLPVIVQLIHELAVYEKLENEITSDPERMRRDLFGSKPVAEVLIAEWAGEPVGFALFFQNYSTFLGKPGLYLEDLFVQPAFRGKGLGKSLILKIAALAMERDCGRFEWAVLDWNQPSIEFYKALGAKPMSEWTIFRLSGDELRKYATAGVQ